MDKPVFENMDFSEYISSMTNSISVEFNKAIVKLLLHDIIDIYEGRYCFYDNYKDLILKENSSIDYSFNYNRKDFKVNFVYIPKHIILEEFVFNYIKELSRNFKGGDE